MAPGEIDWVEVPAGILTRGTDERDVPELVRRHADLGIPMQWFLKECPRGEVPVPAFVISRTPVTNAHWAAFARARGHDWRPVGGMDHPVTGVSWAQASGYAAWFAGISGMPVRLPTEDEWERAARGDDAREFPWGDDFRPGRANLRGAGYGDSLPVGSFPAGESPFGVLDLVGNVDEWTSTEHYPYPGAPASVPAREAWAVDPHITRGGSWQHDRDLARCARRHGAYDPTLSGVGFRLARSAARPRSV